MTPIGAVTISPEIRRVARRRRKEVLAAAIRKIKIKITIARTLKISMDFITI